MSADLLIGRYLLGLPSVGCCPNRVYAVIFNTAGQVLDKLGLVYGFTAFDSSLQENYKLPLTETRAWFYSGNIPAIELTSVPENLPDEPYHIEYWHQAGVTAVRLADTIQDSEKFWWNGGRRVDLPLSVSDRGYLSYMKSHVAVAFDSTTSSLKFVGWLEKSGKRVTNPLNCEIKWLKRDGSTIANFTLSSTMSGMPGVFQAEQAVVDLTPDEATPISVKITDADGVVTESTHGITSWD